MQYWLFKSEPFKFSWDDLKRQGKRGEEWDGVRNYQARNNMREMKVGDLGFFYHSNEGKQIVGICEVCALAHHDSTTDDDRWECVDIRALADMPVPVSLADVKANEALETMPLVTSMRLSVQPVPAKHWKEVCKMGGLDTNALQAGKAPLTKPAPATAKTPPVQKAKPKTTAAAKPKKKPAKQSAKPGAKKARANKTRAKKSATA